MHIAVLVNVSKMRRGLRVFIQMTFGDGASDK